MPDVAVVTDTTHYMPRALVEELGVHEVSLYVTFEGVTAREAGISGTCAAVEQGRDQLAEGGIALERVVEPEFVSEMGPVIGAHVGPGLLGVSGIPRRLLYPGG